MKSLDFNQEVSGSNPDTLTKKIQLPKRNFSFWLRTFGDRSHCNVAPAALSDMGPLCGRVKRRRDLGIH